MAEQEPEIIEAQIVEDFDTNHAKRTILAGEGVELRANQSPSWHTPGDHARPQGDLGGMLGGFLTLTLGFLVTVFFLLISVCIIIPFTLLLRLINVQKHH